MEIFAKKEGICIGCDVTGPLSALFSRLKDVEGEKVLKFEKGTYFLSAKNSQRRKLYITNTVGDKEWRTDEEPHMVAVGIYLHGIKNLKIIGDETVFCVQGQMTNLVMENCEDIKIEGIAFRTENPNLHGLRVKKTALFYTDFELDAESTYRKKGRGFEFFSADYTLNFFANRTAHWIIRTSAADKFTAWRSAHPFFGALRVSEKGEGLFRAYYAFPRRFEPGEGFYLYDSIRKNVGIFLSGCKDIVFDRIKQYFNYSLAIVMQDCENFTLESSVFAPEEGSAKQIASLADFIQVCMCKGDIRILNNRFSGAGDDCLNVHGVHFVVTKIEENMLTLRFCHPQTHGFNPLHVGDTVEYIDANTLLTKGKASILSSVLVNEYEILLEVDDASGAVVGCAVEDVTMCPNLLFKGNTVSRIVTRGLLITTRGKVLVEDNLFQSTSMHSILFSNDAKNWFESGRVTDVKISGNTFLYCPTENIAIKPENTVHEGAVHSGFVIENNQFNSVPGGIYIKSAQNITVKNNRIADRRHDFLKTKDVTGLNAQG